jgi:hypothetical protein
MNLSEMEMMNRGMLATGLAVFFPLGKQIQYERVYVVAPSSLGFI